MNDSFVIVALFAFTLGFVLLVAIAHFAWMMKDRKMREVATGSNPHDLSFVPFTGYDMAAGILVCVLLFGALAGGVMHSH